MSCIGRVSPQYQRSIPIPHDPRPIARSPVSIGLAYRGIFHGSALRTTSEGIAMDEASANLPIGRYEYIRYQDPAAAYRPYDPRFPDVASRVIDLIRDRMPDALVEHIGSTAIPGCPGKGVVDLMLLYPAGWLDTARSALDQLGFQRHD
jgi:hypothetical protein